MDPRYPTLRDTTPEQARIMGKKGGQASTPAKKYAALFKFSHKAKCKRCQVACVFKKSFLAEDPEMVCRIPEARAQAIFNGRPIFTVEVLQKVSSEALLLMMNEVEKNKSVKNLKVLIDAVNEMRKANYPVVPENLFIQNNTQININFQENREKTITHLENRVKRYLDADK